MKTKLSRPAPRSTSKATATAPTKYGELLDPEVVRCANEHVSAAEAVLADCLVNSLASAMNADLDDADAPIEYATINLSHALAHLIRSRLAPPCESVLARIGTSKNRITLSWVQFVGGCGMRIENFQGLKFIVGPRALEELLTALESRGTTWRRSKQDPDIMEAGTRRAFFGTSASFSWSDGDETRSLHFQCPGRGKDGSSDRELLFSVAGEDIQPFKAAALLAKARSIDYHKRVGLSYRRATGPVLRTVGMTIRPLELPDSVRVRIHQRHDR